MSNLHVNQTGVLKKILRLRQKYPYQVLLCKRYSPRRATWLQWCLPKAAGCHVSTAPLAACPGMPQASDRPTSAGWCSA
eukprot:Skav226794  [mRNA]  locus=scaffold8:500716:500952:- [translate_table: standard]